MITEELKKLKEEVRPKINELCEKYVGDHGSTGKFGPELLRAFQRIEYRFYNDGDIFSVGYGRETCGSSAVFLWNKMYSIKENYDVSDETRDLANHAGGELDYMQSVPYEGDPNEVYELHMYRFAEILVKILELNPAFMEESESINSRNDKYLEKDVKKAWGDYDKGIDFNNGILKGLGCPGLQNIYDGERFESREIHFNDLKDGSVKDDIAYELACIGINPEDNPVIAEVTSNSVSDDSDDDDEYSY